MVSDNETDFMSRGFGDPFVSLSTHALAQC